MFRIKNIIMANFSRFDGVNIPLDGETSVFTGPNGSGKSTTFDAARLVLGSRKLANEKRDLVKEYLTHPHTYTVLGIVAYNRRKDGKPAIFRKLALKEEFVTLARVYIPKAQSIESKFLLLDGEHNADAILDRIEKGDGFGEQRYMDKLATIGITLATLDQIIIRQGKVIEVTMGGPKQLHQKVMNHAGASETMLEYRSARDDADNAARKLEEREEEQCKATRQLRTLEDAVDAKKKYDQKLGEIAENKDLEQAAAIHADLIQAKKYVDSIPDLEEDIKQVRQDRADAKPDIDELDRAVEAAAKKLQDWDEATQDIAATKAKAEKAKAQLEEPHARYVLAQAELPPLSDLPPTADAKSAASTAAAKAAKALADETEKLHLANAAKERYETLKAGRTPWPPLVATTLRELEAAGIVFSCLAHQLSPDPSHRGAIEGALGNRRFAIAVDHKDHARVIAIAVKHAFPGPIYEKGAETAEASDVWNAESRVPAWLNGFTIKEGRALTPEGTWVAIEPHPLLGPEPTKEDLATAKTERDNVETARANAKRARELAQREHEEALALVTKCERRDAHQATIRNAGDMPAHYAALAFEYQELDAQLRTRAEDKKKLTSDLSLAREKLRRLREHDKARAAKLFQLESKLATAKEQSESLTTKANRSLLLLPQAVQARAKNLNEPMRDAEAYQRLAKQAEAELSRMKQPEPDVEAQHARFKLRAAEYKRRVDEQQEIVQGTLADLERARKQYAVFQTQHLEEYKRRFTKLTTDFGIACSVNYTAIRPDSTDQEIDNAVLDVRTGYNGKEPALVQGGGFSGGEEILNGLMLQLALRELDSEGFIMVDQPYDHLDSVNAREVAEYLSHAPMQVIIAVPSSLSPEHYHGMARGVLFQKAQGNDWAPLPEVVAVRGP